MYSRPALKMDPSILQAVECTVQNHTVDALLEGFLGRLLQVDDIRKMEISLFNKRNDLVSVATAINSVSGAEKSQEIRVQSWLLESSVRHSTRRARLPQILPVLSIPLVDSEGILGFMHIQWDHIPVADRDRIASYHFVGLHLGSRIKEVMLKEEISRLRGELDSMVSINRENVQQITSLSKELYAMSAISTKINQSMDYEKALWKSMVKIKEIFRHSSVVVNVKNAVIPRLILPAEGVDEGPLVKLLNRTEGPLLKDIMGSGKPVVREHCVKHTGGDPRGPLSTAFKTIAGAPLKSRERVLGALLLLNHSDGGFSQDELRLLSGVASIMGMAIENMRLYHHTEQKKREAAFLVRSIAKFNEKLDLAETLRSVAEKSAEFIGLHCRVFLFSETRVPLVEALFKLNGKKRSFQSEAYKKILPAELEGLYRLLSRQGRPFLARRLNRSDKISVETRRYFREKGLHSLMAIPLRLMGKRVGLLVLGSVTGQRAFDHNDLSVAVALGAAAVVAIENARAHATSLEMSEFLEKKIVEKTTQIQRIEDRQSVRVEYRNDIIFRVNKANRFVFVNKAMEVVTGCRREELYRGAIRAEDVVCEVDRDRVREVFKSILRGEFPMVKDLEYNHLNLKGDDHVISLTVYPEMDLSGRIVGLEGVGRDITEQKKLEAELEKAKDLAMLGEFSAALAHQVRNPLGNILMGTKLLERGLGLAAEHPIGSEKTTQGGGCVALGNSDLRKVFSDLSQGIHNLNQIVTRLLEYTKTLKPKLSAQRIDLVLRESLCTFQDMARQNGIRIEEDFDPNLPLLSVDVLLMGQAFQNVIHNAIQAMPSGGLLLLACRFYPLKPNCAFVSISDSGEGMAPCELEKIFRPFYTTKHIGVGLGLSLAHRIVEAHNGQIWACNNPCLHLPPKAPGTYPKEISPLKGLTIHILLPIDRNRQWDSVHGSMKNECTGPGSR